MGESERGCGQVTDGVIEDIVRGVQPRDRAAPLVEFDLDEVGIEHDAVLNGREVDIGHPVRGSAPHHRKVFISRALGERFRRRAHLGLRLRRGHAVGLHIEEHEETALFRELGIARPLPCLHGVI